MGRPAVHVARRLYEHDAWAGTKPGIKDIYYCLSRQGKVGKIVNGKAQVSRSQQDALYLRALWLDIDIKAPPKGYATLDEAIVSLGQFNEKVGLPPPTALVSSGGGLHCYWFFDRPLSRAEWQPYGDGLKAAAQQHGLRCDPISADSARILRVPGTRNFKFDPPAPVRLLGMRPDDYPVEALAPLLAFKPTFTGPVTAPAPQMDLSTFAGKKPAAGFEALTDKLSDGIREELPPLDPTPVIQGCPFFRDAFKTGGKDHSQGLWNLSVLSTVFMKNGEQFAHAIGDKHPGYTPDSTKEMFARKTREHKQRGIGWPSCAAIQSEGCKLCSTCKHFGKIKSPLNLARPQQLPQLPPSFVDPYADFVGPAFPFDVLPPALTKFVDAEHRAMGADPSAIAMAVLTVVAGALHAETKIRAGEGWWEKPILWTALVGQPSTMKSPIIDKTKKPLLSVDQEREKRWKQEYAIWQQNNKK